MNNTKQATEILNQMISELKKKHKDKDYSFILSSNIFDDLNTELKRRVITYKGFRVHHSKMLKSDVAYIVRNSDLKNAMDHLRMLSQEL